MNADRLLSYLERCDPSADSLAQVRKLIVSLAISGQLGTKDRVPVVTESRPLQSEELPLSTLKAERFVRLSTVAEIRKGLTGIQKAKPGTYPLVVTAKERATTDHYDFEGEAAIVPLISSTGHGKASLHRLHYQDGRFAVGNILAAVFPHDPTVLTARFLFEYMTAFKEELLVSRMTGTANVALTIGKLAAIPVPLVSISTQTKVDELMMLCDRLEASYAERESRRDRLVLASLNRLGQPTIPDEFKKDAGFYLSNLTCFSARPEHIKELRKAILNLAVRGKLVPQEEKKGTAKDHPQTEDGQMLLDRIVRERGEKWEKEQLANFKKKGKEPPKNWQSRREKPSAPDISELPELPNGWVWATVDQLVASVTTGATPSRTDSAFWDQGTIPWVTSSVVNEDTVTSATEFITHLALEKTNTKLFPPGTLLVALYGEGKTRGKVTELLISAATNQACAALIFDESHVEVRPFIKLYFRHNYDSMRRLAAGGVQPNLSVSLIRELPIPLPPLAEQKRIVAKVDELMAICDQLENQLESQQKVSRRLLEALLHEALEGVG